MRARRPHAVDPSRWAIPDPGEGDIVGFGADLAPETLVDAYRRGIFPWPHGETSLPWFSPDPRGVIPFDRIHVSRSLRRTLRSSRWETTVDAAFDDVIAACAAPRSGGSWITDEMRCGYTALHRLGWAHSIETWEARAGAPARLVGGLYGVAIGGLFAGESMFHRVPDASKVALVALVDVLRVDGLAGRLLDVQWCTPHLATLGCVEVRRRRYLRQLADALTLPLPPAFDDSRR